MKRVMCVSLMTIVCACGEQPGPASSEIAVEFVGRSNQMVGLLSDLGTVLERAAALDLPWCVDYDFGWTDGLLEVVLPADCEIVEGIAVAGNIDLQFDWRCSTVVPDSATFNLSLAGWSISGEAYLASLRAMQFDARMAPDGDDASGISFGGCLALDEDSGPTLVSGALDLGTSHTLSLLDVQKRACDAYPGFGALAMGSDGKQLEVIFNRDTPRTGEVTLEAAGSRHTLVLPELFASRCPATFEATDATGDSACVGCN